MTRYYLTSDFPIFPIDALSESGQYIVEVQAQNVGDGYHTMKELYEHRYRLFLALLKAYDYWITPLGTPKVRCWKSKLHDDGSQYKDSFIAGMTVTKPTFRAGEPDEKFDISYHLPMKYWYMCNVIELERAPKYDGYTSKDVLERLLQI